MKEGEGVLGDMCIVVFDEWRHLDGGHPYVTVSQYLATDGRGPRVIGL